MSTALSVLDYTQLPSTQVGTDEQLLSLAKSADFIGRLQLYTKGKAIDKGKIRPGHYGIEAGEEITDLGDSIDIMPLARKTKAIDMSDKEAIIVSYDMNSAEFKRIQAQAQEKESNCMYGPSFLVIERSTGRFLEFFCGSKSTRGEAGKIYPFMTLTADAIEKMRANGQDVSKMEPHGPLPTHAQEPSRREGLVLMACSGRASVLARIRQSPHARSRGDGDQSVHQDHRRRNHQGHRRQQKRRAR
jgi:hypothetical protein